MHRSIVVVAVGALLAGGCARPAAGGADAGVQRAGSDGGIGDGGAGPDGGALDAGTPDGGFLAAKYPGDKGIGTDPSVVWAENFEEGSIAKVIARYDDSKPSGLALSTDVPPGSSGTHSLKATASGSGPSAADLYKNLGTGYDALYMRYYVKYQAGAKWHHTGVWLGGYNPPLPYPYPKAGLKPNGDDRFSVSFEPVGSGPNPRMDFYNYWMMMHSWMAQPSGSTAYYGNTILHDTSVKVPDGKWFCVEEYLRLNPDPTSGAGAELTLWVNDKRVQDFTDTAPLGYWVRDKFCPKNADGTECTNYEPANPTLVPLDLQFRSTTALKINAFWPQNYITSGGAGSVWFDDMVLAKRRIGCLR